MNNVFINLINNKKINSLEDLKKAFRKIAKKTHPDIVGSDLFVEKFIEIKNYYDETKIFLENEQNNSFEDFMIVDENFRLLFFNELRILDALELPHNKNDDTEKKIKIAKENLLKYFTNWKNDYIELYISADVEYCIIKNEKYKNDLANLRKPLLYQNLRPIFYNLCSYHITGTDFYKKQLERNFELTLLRLENNNFYSLKKYLLFLIDDIKNGPVQLS